MIRISSRQRLVSWDAFDATAKDSGSDHAEVEEDYCLLPITSTLNTKNGVTVNREEVIPSQSIILSVEATNANEYFKSLTLEDEHDVSLKRKRSTPIQWREEPKIVHSIPTDDESMEDTVVPTKEMQLTEDVPTKLMGLTEDAQWQVLSFLDYESACQMMQVNRYFRHIMTSRESTNTLWKDVCYRQWPWLATQDSTKESKIMFVDDLQFSISKRNHVKPIVCVATTTTTALSKDANLAMLLHMATNKPYEVDEAEFVPRRSFRLSRRTRSLGRASMEVELKTISVPGQEMDKYQQHSSKMERDAQTCMFSPTTTTLAVQFMGSIGYGDRCIRANHPLPQPTLMTYKQQRRAQAIARKTRRAERRYNKLHGHYSSTRRSFLMSCLRMDSGNDSQKLIWKPFVAPFLSSVSVAGDQDHVSVNMTPRLIAYFEVTIMTDPTNGSNDAIPNRPSNEDAMARPANLVPPVEEHEFFGFRRRQVSECVAVGLANEQFNLHKRMPGWDTMSFGYHGDDGGIFHANGNMIRSFGPTYGAGDTVGCGIDYQRHAIFYTINGKFLGYAFENLERTTLEMSWYPVVGLDSHCPVVCNFGNDRPFYFDLTDMMHEQESVIQPALNV